MTHGHAPHSPAYRRLLAALFLAGVATFAQLYSAQAVLPQIASSLDVAPSAAALSVSVSTLGLAASVIAWSAVADRHGRVRAMVTGIVVASILGLLAPLSNSLALLLAIRFVEGAALGAIPAIALVYLSEQVAPAHVARAAGSYIAGTTVGGLLGRLVAGSVGGVLDWRGGMWATATVCLVAAALFIWLVAPGRGVGRESIVVRDRPRLWPQLAANLRSPVERAILAQGLILMGVFVAVYNYVGFHLAMPPFLVPAWLVSLLFLAYLAGTVSSPFAGILASRHGRFIVLIASTGTMLTGCMIQLVPSTVAIVCGLVLFTAGFFAAHTVASGWAPEVAPAGTRAQASSLYYLGYYTGSSFFGWCLGLVFADFGWAAFVFACVALILMALAIATYRLRALPSS